jgi:hypothetical protein
MPGALSTSSASNHTSSTGPDRTLRAGLRHLNRDRRIMLIFACVGAAAALAVVAYQRLQDKSPESAAAGLRMVREFAAVVLVCTKAIEGIADALAHQRVQAAPATTGRGYRSYNEYDEDEQP